MYRSKFRFGKNYFFTCFIAAVIIAGIRTNFMLAQIADERIPNANVVLRAIIPDTVPILIRQFIGKPVILNVWATWCKPCVEELPDLLQLQSNYSSDSVALILISADNEKILETHVRLFLQKLGVTFNSYLMSSGYDQDFIEEIDPNWTGAIPHTLFFDRAGHPSEIFNEKQTYSDFERALKKIL